MFDVSAWINPRCIISEGTDKAYLKAVTGVSFTLIERGQTLAGGRVGLKQSDGARMVSGLCRRPPAAPPLRQHHFHLGATARRGRAAEAAPPPADDLPGILHASLNPRWRVDPHHRAEPRSAPSA
jgi:hypothetical protein